MTEKQVKIPYSLYQDLVRYFLAGADADPDAEDRIKNALREKQNANERRLLYSVKLETERRSRAQQKNPPV
jgi:hypothetical protein